MDINIRIRCFVILMCFPFVTFGHDRNPQEDIRRCLSNYSPDTYTSASLTIYTPTDPSYLTVLDFSIQNLRFETPDTPKPLMIVTAVDISQVQATVYCTRKHGLQLRVRSGGHDYEGLSYTSGVPFIVLDLANLRSIAIDAENETAWVQSGATLGEVYYSINQKSTTLGFPAGVCPTVGVGGHFSGGGYGMLLRKYGLAADHIIDALVVDVNGKLLDRESMGEDLFWAIRGGGGGTFGVVVSWEIKLVRVPETVTVSTVSRTLDQNATGLAYKWQLVAATEFPDDLHMRLTLLNFNGSDGKKTIQATFETLYLGEADELLDVVGSIFPELGMTRESCTEMPWINSTLYAAEFTGYPLEILLNRSSSAKYYFKYKSDYVKEPISETGLEKIWKWLLKADVGTAEMIWVPYGGRMSMISDSTIPFPHRAGNLFMIQHLTGWMNGSVEESTRHLTWIRRFYKSLKPYVSKSPRSAYINYRDLDIGMNNEIGNTSYRQASIWGTKYFNQNFDRLVKVKTASIQVISSGMNRVFRLLVFGKGRIYIHR